MNKIIFWVALIVLINGILYVASDTIIPFFVAFIFAYLLAPVVQSNCNRFNISRGVSSSVVFTIFISGFVAIFVLIVPIIYEQFAIFVSKIPQYKSNVEEGIYAWLNKINNIDPELSAKISESIRSAINSAFTLFSSFANHLWQYTLATINIFIIIILVPIILYYFLRDWPFMIDSIESLFPRKSKKKIREIFYSIDGLLSAYIRGQMNICLMLTIYYVIGLEILGFDLALLLGMISGFLIIIPFIGAVISFLLVIIVCYVTFGYGAELLYTTLLFAVGHTIEGYILAPKIIGGKIGLHPLWIIFAMFAAGSLFGVWGVMFAIPMAGILKILLSNMIDYYKSTKIYTS